MAELYPGLNHGTKHSNDNWSGPAPIRVLTGIEAIQKRPYLYVGQHKDNNGLNVVKEAISYATNVVSRGGEAFIRYGDGSHKSQFVVRTFEDLENIDFEKMFALHCGKLEDKESYRSAQLGVTLALCKEFEIIHFTKGEHRVYRFFSGNETPNFSQPNEVDLPGVQFRMLLDLNVVDRVPFREFIQYLAENPWFHWSIETEEIFRGKL
jgi:hypothetical protein